MVLITHWEKTTSTSIPLQKKLGCPSILFSPPFGFLSNLFLFHTLVFCSLVHWFLFPTFSFIWFSPVYVKRLIPHIQRHSSDATSGSKYMCCSCLIYEDEVKKVIARMRSISRFWRRLPMKKHCQNESFELIQFIFFSINQVPKALNIS